MSLVEVPVRQLHQGVSRQPDHVRFPGQLQDATNQLFRVEDAGFTKRYGSQSIASVANPPGAGVIQPFHVIDLGVAEKYGLTVDGSGGLHIVNLLSGVVATVTLVGSPTPYITLPGNPQDFAFTTILDYTFVLNKSVTVLMTSDLSLAPVFAIAFQIEDGRAGTYSITVDGHTVTHTTSATLATDWDTTAIASAISTSLNTALGAAYNVGGSGGNSTILVKRVDNAAMSCTASGPSSTAVVIASTGIPIATTDLLPAFAYDSMGMTIAADANVGTPAFYMEFVSSPPGSNTGYWKETIAPGINYRLDATTMPHVLIRDSLNQFTFQAATWDDQKVGDRNTIPLPDFVNQTINDITVFRDRLDLLTGEFHWFSATGEFFRFWPEFSTQSLDNDPFGIRGSSGRVNVQRFAVPYRKILWSESDVTQFELSSASVFSPKQAVMDMSTTYLTSSFCRPQPMQQMLYFMSFNGGNAIVLEYSYDYFTLTSMATDITKHVRGYIPQNVVDMTIDPPTGNLFLLSDSDRSSLYLWTVYWNGMQSTMGQREQSSWSKWTFPGATIHGCSVTAGVLYLLVTRADGLFIESVQLAEGALNFPLFTPRLDRQVQITGTYNSTTNQTTYTLPYPAAGTTCITPDGLVQTVVSAVGDTLVVAGNPGSGLGSDRAMIGFTYPSSAVLSKQYHRDAQGTAILNGILRLQTFTVQHTNTGYYQVQIVQNGRDTEIYPMTGRLLADRTDAIATRPIVTGVFMKPITADALTATITIENDTYLPHTISAVIFKGEFNELVRQG